MREGKSMHELLEHIATEQKRKEALTVAPIDAMGLLQFKQKCTIVTETISIVAEKLRMIPMSSGIVTHDGKLLCVLGVCWSGKDYHYTWAIAGEMFSACETEDFKRRFGTQIAVYF